MTRDAIFTLKRKVFARIKTMLMGKELLLYQGVNKSLFSQKNKTKVPLLKIQFTIILIEKYVLIKCLI